MYVHKFAPRVWSAKRKEIVPVFVVFADLMETLDVKDEKTAKYRKELLGNNPIIDAPEGYWDMQLAKEYVPDRPTVAGWNALPIHDRAQIKAWSYLNNSVQIIERHQDMMEQKRKAMMEAGTKGKKTSGP